MRYGHIYIAHGVKSQVLLQISMMAFNPIFSGNFITRRELRRSNLPVNQGKYHPYVCNERTPTMSRLGVCNNCCATKFGYTDWCEDSLGLNGSRFPLSIPTLRLASVAEYTFRKLSSRSIRTAYFCIKVKQDLYYILCLKYYSNSITFLCCG